MCLNNLGDVDIVKRMRFYNVVNSIIRKYLSKFGNHPKFTKNILLITYYIVTQTRIIVKVNELKGTSNTKSYLYLPKHLSGMVYHLYNHVDIHGQGNQK